MKNEIPQTESFTVRVGKEIVLKSSDKNEVRDKSIELKKEQSSYFTISNDKEEWTHKFQKSHNYMSQKIAYIHPEPTNS